jgi:tetratricopeptide (TPR) repeat protein
VILLALLACRTAGERGDRAWAEQDVDGAIRAYSLGRDMSDRQNQRYARALLQVGDPEGADQAMKMVVILSGDGHVVEVLREENPTTALALAEFGLGEFPEPALFLNACTLALQIGSPSAMQHCTQAALVLPMDPVPRLATAELSLQQGLLPSAREILRSAGQLDLARDQRVWLSSLWQAAGEPEQACSAGLILGEDLYPVAAACLSAQHPAGEAMLGRLKSPEAEALRLRLAVGRAEVATPGPQQARQVAIAHSALRQCAALQQSAGVLTDAARLALVEEDQAQAELLLSRAMSSRPAELAPWLNMARLMARDGRGEEALALLDAAPSFGPTEDLALQLERLQLAQSIGRLDVLALQAVLDACVERGQARCLAESSYLMAIHYAHELGRSASHLDTAVIYGGVAFGLRALGEPALLPVLRSPQLGAWDQDPRFADIRVQAQKMPTR